MKPGRIRPIALAILRYDGHLLVFEGYDPIKQQTFYRLVGGGIEFGEYGHETIVREVREELGAEIKDVRYAGALENIFTFAGEKGHEIALLYEADFVDRRYCESPELEAHEDDGSALKVLWRPISFFVEGCAPLYPDGILKWLREHGTA